MIKTLDELAEYAEYSFLNKLNPNPDARDDGVDHAPRQVSSGHYVPVKPTPIENPTYVAHSKSLFDELGLDENLAKDEVFMRMFSADTSELPKPMHKLGWATGYALSIYGTEYYEQCPFKTGNGYGDGRAISIFEGVFKGKRWEMQLKGAGQTPYCRGADGRAVLRSSIREFLAQEHMHALGVPTSRSLTLYVSTTQKVQRPWYSEASQSRDPDMMVLEKVAISTRVASSFIRVGQLELFGRRARKDEYPKAHEELEMLVEHLIEREYSQEIESTLNLPEKVLALARAFRTRLSALVANWVRVGYCQGNFNSDNCAAGGFTLDYGPFGFMEVFDPEYQPWTGGGKHFSFLNQPNAAAYNFHMFCTALEPLVGSYPEISAQLEEIRDGFAVSMHDAMRNMWAAKLGLDSYDATLFKELAMLMMQTSVDYTIFFRELSNIPDTMDALEKSFYATLNYDENLDIRWNEWLKNWKSHIAKHLVSTETKEELSQKMKSVNPKYILREWLLVDAYKQAQQGDYGLIKELQLVMTDPYAEQSKQTEEKYYRLRPSKLFNVGGISHISCSS